jgi:hypothetical protein
LHFGVIRVIPSSIIYKITVFDLVNTISTFYTPTFYPREGEASHIAPLFKQGRNSKSKVKEITPKKYVTKEFSFLCLLISNYSIVL